ncbi:MAG: hypothetical protein RIC14_00210 [Filomicrobium sp.]
MSCPVCGFDKRQSKRSVPQHRRFFGLLKAFFDHWPEYADFQPDNVDHLRAWALVRAKHRNVTIHDIGDGMTCIPSPGGYVFSTEYQGAIVILSPKSISFSEMSHQEACAVFDDVQAALEAETGLKADEVMKAVEEVV